MPQKVMQIQFPIAGINRSTAYQQQPPYTCYDAVNVVPHEPGQGRNRGGSRPGQIIYAPTANGTAIRLLERVLIKTNDKYDFWSESFDGYTSLSAAQFATITNLASTSLPSVSDGMIYAVSDTTTNRSLMMPSMTGFDLSATFRFGVYVVPDDLAFGGTVRLYFGMGSGAGDANNCYYWELSRPSAAAGWSTNRVRRVVAGTVSTVTTGSTISGEATPGWFEIQITDTAVLGYWRGTQVISSTLPVGVVSSGQYLGLYLANASATPTVPLYVDAVRIQYNRTGNYDLIRPRLVVSENGFVYRESYSGFLTVSATTLKLASDRRLMAADRGQKLYIADFSEPIATASDGVISGAGTSFDSATFPVWTTTFSGLDEDNYVLNVTSSGTSQGTRPITAVAAGNLTITGGTDNTGLTFRIERSPKIYDPVADTLIEYRATSGRGTVPVGCSIVFRYRDRIIFCGDPLDPNEVYASRLGDPHDWLFTDADDGAAFKLSTSEAGTINDVIVAAAPYADQYALFWGRNSTWRMSGDITSGGSIDAVSNTIGCVSRTAWCHGSKGAEVFWLSRDGLYVTNIECPTCDVISLSREKLPRELIDVNTRTHDIAMAYDVRNRWVHIYITPNTYTNAPTSTRHWLFDVQGKGFFHVTFGSSIVQPVIAIPYQGIDPDTAGVLTGGSQGGIRRMSWRAEFDDSTTATTTEPISNYVLLGPFGLGRTGRDFAMVQEICATLGHGSSDVDWDLYGGLSAEDAVQAAIDGSSAFASGTFVDGAPRFDHPRFAGGAWVLKLTGGTFRWSMEDITALIADTGKGRA